MTHADRIIRYLRAEAAIKRMHADGIIDAATCQAALYELDRKLPDVAGTSLQLKDFGLAS